MEKGPYVAMVVGGTKTLNQSRVGGQPACGPDGVCVCYLAVLRRVCLPPVLQGHTADTNSGFLTRALRRLGVSVRRITVVPDVQEVIAKEVALLSPQYTHLLTSGGIGPTHDDVTFESVAMAFQEEVVLHPELARLVEEFFGKVDKESGATKLAMVPLSAKLHYGVDPQTRQPLRYPLVRPLLCLHMLCWCLEEPSVFATPCSSN